MTTQDYCQTKGITGAGLQKQLGYYGEFKEDQILFYCQYAENVKKVCRRLRFEARQGVRDEVTTDKLIYSINKYYESNNMI